MAGAAVVVLATIEIAFRIALSVRGIRYVPPRRLRDLYIVPHPYLPYVLRPNANVSDPEPARYPLHPGRYEFRTVRTNEHRLSHGPLSPTKPAGQVRVFCLGASTTQNSLWEVGGEIEHSYPLWLARYLEEERPASFEVVNCGVGGWTTAEILVNFALHLMDLRPDVVVLYHGLNDLTPSLTAPFRSDYSHSRRNFGEAYERIRRAARLPNFPWWLSYSYAAGRIMGFGNVRHDVHSAIRVGAPDLKNDFMGLDTERRNIENLIILCKARSIVVILATFAYHVYAAVADDPVVAKYGSGVVPENAMIRDLGDLHGVPVVDIARTIPDDDAYFVDTIHLSPEGMRYVAREIAAEVTRSCPV